MLSAVVDPDVFGDLESAGLVAAKEMGNGLSKLGSCVTVLDKHAVCFLGLVI